MDRTKKVVNNSIASALQQSVNMLIGFILPRIILLYYGSQINGLITSISQIILYITLIEAGVSGASIYSLYKPLAEKSWDKVSSIVSATRKTYIKLGYLFIAITSIFAIIYPFYINVDNLSNIEISLLVLVLGTTGAIEFFALAKYRALLTASQRSYILSLTTMFTTIIYSVIIITLSILKINIVLVRIIAIFSIFLRSIILSLYTKKVFNKINYKAIPNKNALDKRWDACYTQILFSVQSGAPIIIISFFTNFEQVSVFSIYNMVFVGLMGIMNIFVTGTYPSVGDIISRNEIHKIKIVYSEIQTVYYALTSIIYSITIIMINSFVNIYVIGVDNAHLYDRKLLGILFVLSSLLQNIQVPQGIFTTAAGMFKEVKYQSTIHVLIIILGGSIAVNIWGIEGILTITLIANLYRFIYYAFFVSKYITKDTWKVTFYHFFKIIIVMIFVYFFSLLFKYLPTNYFEWIGMSFVIGFISITSTLLVTFIFERNNFISISQRFIKIIKRSYN